MMCECGSHDNSVIADCSAFKRKARPFDEFRRIRFIWEKKLYELQYVHPQISWTRIVANLDIIGQIFHDL